MKQQHTNIRPNQSTTNGKEIIWSVSGHSKIGWRRQIFSGPSSKHLKKSQWSPAKTPAWILARLLACQKVGSSSRGGCGSIVRGRGIGHYTAILNKNKGLSSALRNNVFDYGQKWAADQMRMTWDNIVNHVRTIHVHDISNKIQNKTRSLSPRLNTLKI